MNHARGWLDLLAAIALCVLLSTAVTVLIGWTLPFTRHKVGFLDLRIIQILGFIVVAVTFRLIYAPAAERFGRGRRERR